MILKYSYNAPPDNRWVFRNKKTGAIASSNEWQVRLGAIAVLKNDTAAGIPSLLPIKKAIKRLTANDLTAVKERPTSSSKRQTIRRQAKAVIPDLLSLWLTQNRGPYTIACFCHWVAEQSLEENSSVRNFLVSKNLDALLFKEYGDRWWQGIVQMQS